jgi:sulfite reductase (NADPH) flavoprotein alpha-component
MFKDVLFQVHWFVGITAGVVLAIVGLTGGMLAFEQEILRLTNRGVITVAPLSLP